MSLVGILGTFGKALPLRLPILFIKTDKDPIHIIEVKP
jgi:hypothetical protein